MKTLRLMLNNLAVLSVPVIGFLGLNYAMINDKRPTVEERFRYVRCYVESELNVVSNYEEPAKTDRTERLQEEKRELDNMYIPKSNFLVFNELLHID
ncbi:MAG TPA: hypothetical protein VJJ23_01585 [Candidatus Nanoarchaeia archaeon]|nr:hypothetical protein [Candidatus Nanoarchaeia archaeon]